MRYLGDFVAGWAFLTVIAGFFHFGFTEPKFVLGIGALSAVLTVVFVMLDDAGCDEWGDHDD